VRECYRIVTAAARLEHRYQRILRAILPAAAATGRCIHRVPWLRWSVHHRACVVAARPGRSETRRAWRESVLAPDSSWNCAASASHLNHLP